MAVIKAVSSKAGIGHAIDYVTKKEKTEEKLVSVLMSLLRGYFLVLMVGLHIMLIGSSIRLCRS